MACTCALSEVVNFLSGIDSPPVLSQATQLRASQESSSQAEPPSGQLAPFDVAEAKCFQTPCCAVRDSATDQDSRPFFQVHVLQSPALGYCIVLH